MSRDVNSGGGMMKRKMALSRAAAWGGMCAALAGLHGCGLSETDGWLWDPSIVGRWEHTPTVVPILDRIDLIERSEGEFVEVTGPTAEDLIPVVQEYEIGSGDAMRVSILDFLAQGDVSEFEVEVDSTGAIELPQLGRVLISGLTPDEAKQRIAEETVAKQIAVEPPVVAIQFLRRRQATFAIYGLLQNVGRYPIPSADYRVIDAITDAGGLPQTVRKVQVIRQVRLSDEFKHGRSTLPRAVKPGQQTQPGDQGKQGKDLKDLIEELTKPSGDGGGMFGAMGMAQDGAQPPVRSGDEPPIDLVEGTNEPKATPAPTASGAQSAWMFLNGQWVKVTSGASTPSEAAGASVPASASGEGADVRDLVTQRVIEVPTGPLFKGMAQYNIVVRPGDVIHVPGPEVGIVYIGGPGINRPGSYDLPTSGRLTLKQAVTAAGGLSVVAIPERVDLIRRIGENREATIRLNLRAIAEGTQPDVFIKPDDQINVGTNFWATPLTVLRQGFRMTYGFGFLVDRNFGNDVFGAPPVNQFGQ
ncbi:MAG: polysaccharide biosynthesis/export family protein [Phycisphaerales bacterium]